MVTVIIVLLQERWRRWSKLRMSSTRVGNRKCIVFWEISVFGRAIDNIGQGLFTPSPPNSHLWIIYMVGYRCSGLRWTKATWHMNDEYELFTRVNVNSWLLLFSVTLPQANIIVTRNVSDLKMWIGRPNCRSSTKASKAQHWQILTRRRRRKY